MGNAITVDGKTYASVIFAMVSIAMVHAQIISANPSNANGARSVDERIQGSSPKCGSLH